MIGWNDYDSRTGVEIASTFVMILIHQNKTNYQKIYSYIQMHPVQKQQICYKKQDYWQIITTNLL